MKSGCRSCALAAASSGALGISRRKITHTFTSIWAMPVISSAPIALRYSVSIRAWAHTKPIRQIVLTVTWTELKSSNAASFVIPAAAAPAPGAIVPQSRGGSRWPRTIRIWQDASVTTAEPTIAVARDQVIDRVADHPWDEVDDPCPLPVRNLARDAQRGFGFCIGLAVRHKRKGIRAIRIARHRPANSPLSGIFKSLRIANSRKREFPNDCVETSGRIWECWFDLVTHGDNATSKKPAIGGHIWASRWCT